MILEYGFYSQHCFSVATFMNNTNACCQTSNIPLFLCLCWFLWKYDNFNYNSHWVRTYVVFAIQWWFFLSLTFVLSHKIFKFFVAFQRFLFLSLFFYSPSVVNNIVLFSLFLSISVFVLIAILIRFFNNLFSANKFHGTFYLCVFDFVSFFFFIRLVALQFPIDESVLIFRKDS